VADQSHNQKIKAGILVVVVLLIAGSHYLTLPGSEYHHAVFRTLFYLPLILGAFWFGLPGAIGVCLMVVLFYVPYVVIQWDGFTIQNFSRILEGGVFNVLGVLLGILVEKEKKRHQEFVAADRLASIGKAVAEIAHDLKTPLMAIGGFTNQVVRRFDPDDPNRRKLEIVMNETARMERMIKEMLEFGRPLELNLGESDINLLIEEAVGIVKPEAENRGVQLDYDLDLTLTTQRIDEMRMKQVLINLIMNAVQASPPESAVMVRTKKAVNKLTIEVEDSGNGIETKNRDAVFQPFFTTKKEGTGLGLPIVKKVVDAHGGRVTWHPNPEAGVTFTITLNG
jgi:two-component system, NtrC family, sensor histidine kinase HydH